MAKDDSELYKEAQYRLISSMIVDESDVSQTLEQVTEDDFEEPSLKLIFAVIVELSRANETITVLPVAKALEEKGQLKKVGGIATLYKMRTQGEEYLTDAPQSLYGRIVRQYSSKSKVRELLKTSIKDFTSDSGVYASDAISNLQASLNEQLYTLSDGSTVSNMSDIADTFMAKIDERARISKENEENAGGLQGIPSLLPTLNELTTGWLNGQMITVGARTGIGKSVFAINCAVAAAQANKSVLFFSLEMGQDEIENRIVSSVTGIPQKALKQGNVHDRKLLEDGLEQFRDMKITIDTEPNLTVDSIRARALKQAQSPEGLDMVIIDYLQLMTPSHSRVSRQELVSEISRGVKLAAKSLEIPFIIVVQLKRPDKELEGSVPTLNDIRESGSIAADSDIVVLLHRPETGDESIAHTQIILDKNRDGPANKTILCHSDLACSVFREVTKKEKVRMTDEDLQAFEDEFDLDNDDDDLEDLDI